MATPATLPTGNVRPLVPFFIPGGDSVNEALEHYAPTANPAQPNPALSSAPIALPVREWDHAEGVFRDAIRLVHDVAPYPPTNASAPQQQEGKQEGKQAQDQKQDHEHQQPRATSPPRLLTPAGIRQARRRSPSRKPRARPASCALHQRPSASCASLGKFVPPTASPPPLPPHRKHPKPSSAPTSPQNARRRLSSRSPSPAPATPPRPPPKKISPASPAATVSPPTTTAAAAASASAPVSTPASASAPALAPASAAPASTTSTAATAAVDDLLASPKMPRFAGSSFEIASPPPAHLPLPAFRRAASPEASFGHRRMPPEICTAAKPADEASQRETAALELRRILRI